MNTYIQNKLDELIETYRKENVIEGSRAYFTEYDAKMIAKRLVTHYQNHIVESLNRSIDGCDWVDIEDGKGRYVNERQLARNIIENIGILQDTNINN